MARFLRTLGPIITLCLLAGCGRESGNRSGINPALSSEAVKVTLQLDWFAEPAHGGFYQAQAKGYYRAAGLDVEIIPGGPGGRPTQKVASGQVSFSMGRSDDMMVAAQQGLPVIVVAALMQHDPQALMLHAEHEVNTFAELDGHSVMAYPGAAWIPFLKRRYDIEFDLQPLTFGLAHFVADPELIQACFITDEPFKLERQGVKVKTLLLSDSGYDPYRVIVANRPYTEANPEVVRAFVAATLRGWSDYLFGDPAPAHQIIAATNEHMDEVQMRYSHEQMRTRRFVQGWANQGERIGHLDTERLNAHAKLLHELGILPERLPLEAYASLEFLPERD